MPTKQCNTNIREANRKTCVVVRSPKGEEGSDQIFKGLMYVEKDGTETFQAFDINAVISEYEEVCCDEYTLCSTNVMEMCDFPNGLDDCDTSSNFIRVLDRCFNQDGELVSEAVTDFEIDATTPYVTSGGEQVICDHATGLLKDTRCYECIPPKAVENTPAVVAEVSEIKQVQIKLQTEIKQIKVSQIRVLSESRALTVNIQSLNSEVSRLTSLKGREADLTSVTAEKQLMETRLSSLSKKVDRNKSRLVALEARLSKVAESSGEGCPCIYGDKLQAVIFYPCGESDNIDHIDYYINGELQDPDFELDGNWQEVECEPCNTEPLDLDLIKSEKKCLPAETPTVDPQEFIGSAAQGANSDDWEAALVGQNVIVEEPTPVGSFTGPSVQLGYTVEFLGDTGDPDPDNWVSTYTAAIESPASQGGVSALIAGYDGTGSVSNRNAFRVTFDQPVGAFSLTALDLESDSNFTLAEIVLYDDANNILQTTPIIYPNGEDGGSEAHNLGFIRSANDVKSFTISVGANASMVNENNNRLAWGDLKFVIKEDKTYDVFTYGEPGGQNLVCFVYDVVTKEKVDIDPALLIDCVPNDELEVTCTPVPAYIIPPSEPQNLNFTGTGDSTWEQSDLSLTPLTPGSITFGPSLQSANMPLAPVTGVISRSMFVGVGNRPLSSEPYGYAKKTFTTTVAGNLEFAWYADNWARTVHVDGVVVTTSTDSNNAVTFEPDNTNPDIIVVPLPAGTHEIIIGVQDTNDGANQRVGFDGHVVFSQIDVEGLAADNQLPPCNGYVLECSNGTYTDLSGNPLIKGTDFYDCQVSSSESVCECLDPLKGTCGSEESATWTIAWFRTQLATLSVDGTPIDFTAMGNNDAIWDAADGNIDSDVAVAIQALSGGTISVVTTDLGVSPFFETVITGVPSGIAITATNGQEPFSAPSVGFEVIPGDQTDVLNTLGCLDEQILEALENQCSVKEHYLCINGVSTPIWVSIDNKTLEIIKAVNTLTLEDVTDLTVNGFVDPCDDCNIIVLANRQCDSYGNYFAGYDQWLNDADYDSQANDNGCPQGAPRNVWMRVRVFDSPASQISDTVLGPYPVDPTGTQYLQALSDISALTSTLGVTIIQRNVAVNGSPFNGFTVQYNTGVSFGLTFQQGTDDGAGGVCWHDPTTGGAAWGLKFETGVDTEAAESVNTPGNLSDAFDNTAWDYVNNQALENCIDI